MKYFVSNGEQLNFTETSEIKLEKDFQVVKDWLASRIGEEICIDTETSGLDPYLNEVLLIIIGDRETQFVIDTSCGYDIKGLFKNQGDYLWVAHNMKFDWKMMMVNYEVDLKKVYDTMIADHRIFQGGSDLRFGLEALHIRYFKEIPNGMDETITKSFVGLKGSHKRITNRHVKYAAVDIERLLDIKEKQEENIQKYNYGFLLYSIEFPLIRYIAKAELEGLKLDIDKWKKIILANKKKMHEVTIELDSLLVELRDEKFERGSKEWQSLNGGKITRTRHVNQQVEQMGLFGDNKVIESKNKKSHTNYGSVDQILKIFAKLYLPLPTENNVYLIPILGDDNKIVKGRAYQPVTYDIVPSSKFETSEPALDLYLTEVKDLPEKAVQFVRKLIEYRGAETAVTNFGENFFEKINPVTKHIHPSFKQTGSETGRLRSGGGRNEKDKMNGQNIPATKAYRECFTLDNTDDYEMCVSDLSGAEVRILCDKANDAKLYEWAVKQDDAHSPIAQACWRNIFLYRAGLIAEEWTCPDEFFKYRFNSLVLSNLSLSSNSEVSDYVNKFYNYIVSKKENKDVRTIFKNLTFAVVYGVYPTKAAKMINVTIDEADVVIKTIKLTIPDSFNYIESIVKTVLGEKNYKGYRSEVRNSYIVLNKRTNSRVWFSSVIEAKKKDENLEFFQMSDIEKACANYPIQGTQADMLKEAMVEIGQTIEKQNLDANLLLSVHDELVYRYKKGTMVTYIHVEKNLTEERTIPFQEFVPRMMIQVANRYMEHFEMGAETFVGSTWTK